MITRDASIAAYRFGLGACPGELAEIGSDPRTWLRSQLKKSAVVSSGLPSSADGLKEFFERTQTLRENRKDLAAASAKATQGDPSAAGDIVTRICARS